MKSNGWVFAAVCSLCLIGGAAAPESLHFPSYRFSISPLEGRTAGKQSVLLLMFLPAVGSFAPNVNVVAQPAPGSMDDYLSISKREFEHKAMKILKADKVDDQTAVIEYTGELQNRSLHFYAKASLKGREVLLATGTATEQQWESVGPQLRTCVDSLRRDAEWLATSIHH